MQDYYPSFSSFLTQKSYEAAYFSLNVLASSQTIIGRFLRSLYVGRITEYLCVSEELNWPCMFNDAALSKGFMQS